jgi:hypothetical protein
MLSALPGRLGCFWDIKRTAKAVAPGVSVTWSSRLAARCRTMAKATVGIGMKATNGDMRSPPIRCCGARLAFVPEGTQSVSVATAKAVAPGVSVTWSSRLAARWRRPRVARLPSRLAVSEHSAPRFHVLLRGREPGGCGAIPTKSFLPRRNRVPATSRSVVHRRSMQAVTWEE